MATSNMVCAVHVTLAGHFKDRQLLDQRHLVTPAFDRDSSMHYPCGEQHSKTAQGQLK